MLIKKIERLIQTQVQCVLATSNNNAPSQHLMAYDYSCNLKHIYLASFSNTQKVKNILENKNVSLLWDNRTGNTSDHNEGVLLTATGKASINNSSSKKHLQSSFLQRNPNLDNLLEHEQSVHIEIDVEKYMLVEGYKEVDILSFV